MLLKKTSITYNGSLIQSELVYRDIRDSSIETLDRSPYPYY